MRFYADEWWVKKKAKRLRRVARNVGLEWRLTTCQEQLAKMYGFDDWDDFKRSSQRARRERAYV